MTMDKNDWDDKSIEKLLGDLPNLQDTQSKEDVLLRLKQDERLNFLGKKNSRTKWIPTLVALCALLMLGLMLPSMLNKENAGTESTNSDSSMKMMEDQHQGEDIELETSQEVATPYTTAEFSRDLSNDGGIYSGAVYPDEVVNHTVFHLGLAGSAAASVPVTFVIPNEQIEMDFGHLEPSSFELYEKYASELDEEGLGFTQYHPYKGTFLVQGDSLIHTLPAHHGYDVASGTMTTYLGTLQDTFYGFEEISFENEDGSVVQFDQIGEPSQAMELMGSHNKFNYYLFEQETGQQFLSSNFFQSYETLELALQDMKNKPNDIYAPVIPNTINFTVTDEQEVATIVFEEPFDIEAMDSIKAMQMIDGMLLTAASFGVQLKFENIIQSEWRGFDFHKPLPMPVGPNLMNLLLK